MKPTTPTQPRGAADRASPRHTLPQVATRLAVSVKTVRRLIDSGRLQTFRVGRGLRVVEDDLRAFLSTCR